MTPAQLKEKHETMDPDSRFFSRNNMKFAGDTMSNYSVHTHEDCDCYELRRKKPVNGGLAESRFFHNKTFEAKSKEGFLIHLIKKNDPEKVKNFYNLFSKNLYDIKKWEIPSLEWALNTAKDVGNQEVISFFEEKLESRLTATSTLIAEFNAENNHISQGEKTCLK